MLPQAPQELPEIEIHLRQAMDTWMRDERRPRLSREIEARWDGYVEQWIAATELPLFVRVGKGEGFEKGCSILRHGRMLIRCDNSPAKWIFRLAFDRPELSFADLRAMWDRKEIPVALVVTPAVRNRDNFMGLPQLGNRVLGDRLGWELSHRREVRLDGKFSSAKLEAFEQHFRQLMSVGNMLLTPGRIGMNHLVDWYFREESPT